MKCIIAGSRTIRDYAIVEAAIEASGFAITQVVSGCARGVDSLGEQWAHQHELLVARFPAEWGRYGKSAGPIRNSAMVQHSDALIAVWDGRSAGTKDMIGRANKRGLRVFVYHVGGERGRVVAGERA